MADAQWAEPRKDAPAFNGMADADGQLAWWRAGYTPQTRLWMDDMFMITVVQLQAFRATGDRRYAARAAHEMVLYLDRLQNPDGLFFHTPEAPFVWSRGNGWMAAGMAMLLRSLPVDDPRRARILDGYRRMMAALLAKQRPDGMWGQLVDDPSSWTEYDTGIVSDNNYDFATLYVGPNDELRIIGASDTGPQPYNPGGELSSWLSTDGGKTWTRERRLTQGSARNQNYPRQPLGVQDAFYALWADGHGRRPSVSRLSFCDRALNVFRLPLAFDGAFARPEPMPRE